MTQPQGSHSRPVHYRAFAADLEIREDADEGMTVTGIVVPYNREAPISEPRADGVISYRELFIPGAFERAIRVPHRVSLTYDHDRSLQNRMGFARSFADSAEGLVGEFRLDASSAAKARDVLTSSHAAFSIGFMTVNPRAGTERPGALVRRLSVVLDHVAAVSQPAYAGAGVASIRAADDIEGEPTAADIAAEAQARADRELLADIEALAAKQAQWDALVAPQS